VNIVRIVVGMFNWKSTIKLNSTIPATYTQATDHSNGGRYASCALVRPKDT
jgi:hypothetical protein